MTEEGYYNGWKNYPTWAVNLWLANDEPLYRETLDMARNVLEYGPNVSQVAEGIWTVEQAIRFNFADDLKRWVEDDLAPDLGASFSADLLGWAFDHVDWEEIADSWIEQASEVPA